MKLSIRKRTMDTIGWGFILWFVGFGLGMLLFPFVPVRFIGLPILAVMLPITALVAYKRLRVPGVTLSHCLLVASTWVLIPLVLDYAFLVAAFKVPGYYDSDVMAYYVLAFLIPLVAGLVCRRSSASWR